MPDEITTRLERLEMAAANGPKAPVRPDPDPTVATIKLVDDKIDSAVKNQTTRINALEDAQRLFHEDLVRVPTNVDRATASLHELVGARMDRIEVVAKLDNEALKAHVLNIETSLHERPQDARREIEHLRNLLSAESKRLEDVSDQRFLRIDAGLTERDKRADQLALANSAALAAALAAQKEAAGEAQKSAALAISKSEGATAEAIKQGQTLFQTAIASLTTQITDLKGRLDKGEGGRAISDPATTQALAYMTEQVKTLTSGSDQGRGGAAAEAVAKASSDARSAWVFAVIASAAAIALVAVDMFSALKH